MAEHAVGDRPDARVGDTRVPAPPPAEEYRLNGPLRITEYRGRPGLRVAGEIDLNSHELWEGALRRAVEEGDRIHLDLSALAFIDVRGTTLLVDAAAVLSQEHGIVLHHAPSSLRRVMGVLWPDGATAIMFEGER
jgi:anti-anti-sigma factor